MHADRRTRIAGGMVIAFFLFLPGCGSPPKPQAAAPSTGPGEIPIPPGFQQIEKESVLITFSGFQAGMVVYEGEREPSWVVQFYRGVLPSQGWTLVASFISKDTILVFTKERQACVIGVSGSRSSSRLEVRVGIVEQPAAASPPASRPSAPTPGPSR